MLNLSKISLCLCVVLSSVAQIAGATKYIDGMVDGSSVNISNKEFTRIAIEGGRIKDIQMLEGELDYKKNEATAEWFVLPKVSKTISVFVRDQLDKTHLILLKPGKQPADSIIIRTSVPQMNNGDEKRRRVDKVLLERNSEAYMSSEKKFMYGIANGQEEEFGLTCTPDGEQVPLWSEAIFIKKRTCTDGALTGYQYSLTNTSNETMVLEEQEFYKKNVTAVAIEKLQIEPNESTEIYILSGAQ